MGGTKRSAPTADGYALHATLFPTVSCYTVVGCCDPGRIRQLAARFAVRSHLQYPSFCEPTNGLLRGVFVQRVVWLTVILVPFLSRCARRPPAHPFTPLCPPTTTARSMCATTFLCVQYLLFACDPYETIGFKVPNLKIDKAEGRFFTNWDKESKKFTVRVMLRCTVQARVCVASNRCRHRLPGALTVTCAFGAFLQEHRGYESPVACQLTCCSLRRIFM